MNQILLIEDDLALQESLRECLMAENFVLEVASNLTQARRRLDTKPELVILDWMLPDGQGIELLKELRSSGNPVPVILLTARSELVDKVLGLELGANDYLTKPFEPRELIARIRVQLRLFSNHSKIQSSQSQFLEAGPIQMNLDTHEVYFQGSEVVLTKMEYALLKLFLESPGKVFSRDEILDMVWGLRYPTTRTVDMHIRQLRQKFSAEYFETVHGTGYRLKSNPLPRTAEGDLNL